MHVLKRDGLGLDSSPDPRHSQLMERNEHGYRWFEHDQKKVSVHASWLYLFPETQTRIIKNTILIAIL
jgi:hypothetical protein